jgi:DNA-binding CsgD family transcriptional regulator/antitoxin (DNA-binding transcriptional repressor) of toxin-antitoxin stability system
MHRIGALGILLIFQGLQVNSTARRAARAIAGTGFAKVWREVAPGEEMTLTQDGDARVAAAIRAAGADARCWPDALDEIAHALNARFAALLFEDRALALLELKYSTHAEKAWIVEYLRNHRKLDPVKARVLTEVGIGRAFSSADFVSLKALHRSGAYQRWMAPFGLADVIGGIIHRSETGACLIVAFRDECAGAADAETKARLDGYLPLLAGAIGDHAAASDTLVLAELFDELTTPVLIVDGKMRILRRNRSADDMLGEGDALAVVGESLTMRDPRAKEALERAVAGIGGADAEAFAIMVKRGESRCCVMHVLPLPNGLSALFLRRLTAAADDGGAVAAELFGLTARESSVLLAIAEVGGVPATARALGLSEGTVKGYLKSIFQKTGATRQADLVKLVLALESPFRAPERHSLPA